MNAYIINMKKKTKIFRIFHIIYDKFFANSKYQKKGGKKNLIIEFFVILQMIVDYRQHLIIKIVRTK